MDQLVEIFDQNGAAIIQGDLNPEVLHQMEHELVSSTAEVKHASSLEGRFRYRAGKPDDYKIEGYCSLLASKTLRQALDLLTLHGSEGSGEVGWKAYYFGGDEVSPQTHNMQDLHSDWPAYRTNSMSQGFALVVAVAPRDIPVDLAPMRLVPWSLLSREQDYPVRSRGDKDLYEEGYEVTLKAGEILIRDCRAAHGGTPNRTEKIRCLPCVQILSPQFQRGLSRGL